jgi:hypothetical protein
MKSKDLEVRRRATRIVKAINNRLAEVALMEVGDLVKAGEIDRAIEQVVRWAEQDRLAQGQQTLNLLLRRLLKDHRVGKVHLGLLIDLGDSVLKPPPADRKKTNGPWDVRWSRGPLVYKNDMDKGVFFLRGRGVTIDGMDRGVITSTGPVKVAHGKFGRDNCIIFSCGPVTVENRFPTCNFLIICDGDVQIHGPIESSLIVARGNVILPSSVTNCVVYAGGTIKRIGGGPVHPFYSLLRENDTSGLGIIKFFDPAKAGIEVTPGKGGVTVEKTQKDKPFATAVRPGDLVTAIDNAKVPSPEAFRRRLRAALAEGSKTITLTVSRSGHTFHVPVRVRR